MGDRGRRDEDWTHSGSTEQWKFRIHFFSKSDMIPPFDHNNVLPPYQRDRRDRSVSRSGVRVQVELRMSA
jgi:hypothetical protein